MNQYQALEYAIDLIKLESKRCLHMKKQAKKQGKEMDVLFWDNLFHQAIEAECELEDIQNILLNK